MSRPDDALSGTGDSSAQTTVTFSKDRITVVLPNIRTKFDGTNGYTWLQHVEMALKGRGLADHLTEEALHSDDPAYKLWKSEESLIRQWMLDNMITEMEDTFLHVKTVKDIWMEIAKNVSKESNDWQTYDLMVQQTQMKQGDLTVMAYAYKLKGIWTEIDHYWPVGDPKSSDRQYTLKQRVFIFLMELNPEFEGVRSQILHREALPDHDQAIGMVIKDEKRFKVSSAGNPGGISMGFNSKRETAAPGKESSGEHYSQESGGSQQTPKDLFCKKRNHTKKNCQKLAWKKKNKKKAFNTTSFGEVQEQIVYKGKAQTGVGSSSDPEGEISLSREEMKQLSELLSSMSIAQTGKRYTLIRQFPKVPHYWILDTGATDHMTPDSDQFKSYIPIHSSRKVLTAGGSLLPVKGIGNIVLGRNCVLQRVLHVPGLKAHLVSLQKLISDTGWKFILDDDSCFLCDKVSGAQTLSVRREGGMLLLDEVTSTCLASVDQSKMVAQIQLQHQRMGHPAFGLLEKTFPFLFNRFTSRELTCEVCQLAKHKRTSFKPLNDRSLIAFECVHSNVWGPVQVPGISGHRWFIVLIDDNTRFMWVHLMKSKSELPNIILKFC